MKQVYRMLFSLIVFIFCCCSSVTRTIHFVSINDVFFNFSPDSSLMLQRGKGWEERKRFHDSCMGGSIYSNALFVRMKDTFRLGTIINRETKEVVNMLKPGDFPRPVFASFFNMDTRPCYSKTRLIYSIDSFLNQDIYLTIDSADEQTNDAINRLIKTSSETEVEIGSWYHIELTEYFAKALDTVKSLIAYKEALLDPANVVLIKSANIMEVDFHLKTNKPVEKDLVALLSKKPIAKVANSNLTAEMILITENRLQVIFRGRFQFAGTFMKAELKEEIK